MSYFCKLMFSKSIIILLFAFLIKSYDLSHTNGFSTTYTCITCFLYMKILQTIENENTQMVSIFVFISIVNTYNVNRQDMLYLITFPDRSKCHYINRQIVKQFDLLYNIVKYGLTVVGQSGCFYTNVLHSISCFHGVQICLSTTK